MRETAPSNDSFKLDFIPSKGVCRGINTVLLALHIAFAFWYHLDGVTVLFGYNLLSIAVCLCNCWLIFS